MSKISLNNLVNTKLSDKLVDAANSIKGGNESECHPAPPEGLGGAILSDPEG